MPLECDNCQSSPAQETSGRETLCDQCFSEAYFVCDSCGGKYGRDTVNTTNGGESLCDDCYSEQYVNCGRCHNETRLEDIRCPGTGRYEGNSLCEDCYNQLFTTCEHCDGETPATDIHSPGTGRYQGQLLCHSCYDEHYISCDRCNEETPLDSSNPEDGYTYCDDCYSDLFTRCDNCGTTLSRDDVVSSDDRDLCDDCASSEDTWESEEYYGSTEYTELRSNRIYSVELETSKCDHYRELRGETRFGAKEDGSVAGMEFVLSRAKGDNGLREIRHFCALADDYYFAVDTHCGFHIHLDVSRLTLGQLKSVATAYHLTELVWQSFVSATRAENTYCGAIRWFLRDIELIRDVDEFIQFCSKQHRYQWFNVHAYTKHRTFEIRLHSGTLLAEKVTNWVKAHTRFADAVAGLDSETLRTMFAGRSTDRIFSEMAKIWADPTLVEYYEKRSAHFGSPVVARELAAV